MSNYNLNDLKIGEIKSALNFDKLPGVEAQLVLAPPYRAQLIEENKLNNNKNPRIAAVLILLYKENNEWHFPVILRNTYKGVHSNQIGFPGGKVELQDKNLAATATRESFEEINSQVNDVEVLGQLTSLYIPPSNFIVHPFIGIYHQEPQFVPCDREVQQIIPIKLEDFMFNLKTVDLEIQSKGKRTLVPSYELPDGLKIWGATAMMLSEFYVFIKKSLNL
ncbi:MAG: NUDIX hydrolase [Weeksellaceae bacterium]